MGVEKKASKNRKANKSGKKLKITKTIISRIPKNELPGGAVFKGYQKSIQQELRIQTNVTLYKRERYQLTDGTYITAPLPENASGQFGPEIKQYIFHQYHRCNVSQTKIHKQLLEFGIQISIGEINNILLEVADLLNPEYEDVGQAGKETAKELRTDDTQSRHKGKNGACLVIQNDCFTYLKSSESKSRKNFLLALRGIHTSYILNQHAFDYLIKYNCKEELIGNLQRLRNFVFKDESQWKNFLKANELSPETIGKKMFKVLEEAALLGSIIENGINPNVVMLSDGAKQYNLFTHALCWIHAERVLQKLLPIDDNEARERDNICDELWVFYKKLKAYKEVPDSNQKQLLNTEFDKIFSQEVTSCRLQKILVGFMERKNELLRVLDFLYIQLHNNTSE